MIGNAQDFLDPDRPDMVRLDAAAALGEQALCRIAEIRIPSERAFRERTRRRVEGIVIDRAVIAALRAL